MSKSLLEKEDIPISIIKIKNGDGEVKYYNISDAINVIESLVRLDGSIEAEEAFDIIKTALWISCKKI